MYLKFMAQEISTSVRLTLQDLLEGRYESQLSKYLCISVDYMDTSIQINIRTTGKETTTYSTNISTGTPFDLNALIFEMPVKNGSI